MWDLILEYGMPTVSWYAEFALRSRVSMSAIGSVIVMANRPSSPWFPAFSRAGPSVYSFGFLPAGLGDAGQLAAVRHGPEADPAQAEPAVNRAGTAAAGAAGVTAHLELRRPLLLDDQRLLGHFLTPP